MDYALAIFVGFVDGAILWPAIRLVPVIAEWMCTPFGKVYATTKFMSIVISSCFIMLMIVIVFKISLSEIVIDRKTVCNLPCAKNSDLRQYMLFSSVWGMFFIGVVARIEKLLVSKFRRRGM